MTISQLVNTLNSLRNMYGEIDVVMPDGSAVTHVDVEMPNWVSGSVSNIYASYTNAVGKAIINKGASDGRLPIIGHGGY